MTILRHPSLPEVEPEPLRFTFGCKFIAESSPRLPRITGPLGDDEEDAAQKWNDWVRPLVELQAEVGRLRNALAEIERAGYEAQHDKAYPLARMANAALTDQPEQPT